MTRIDVRLLLPAGFPAARREALSRVVERCTVSNSLRQPPVVAFALESADQVA